jgi:hypothetical protein
MRFVQDLNDPPDENASVRSKPVKHLWKFIAPLFAGPAEVSCFARAGGTCFHVYSLETPESLPAETANRGQLIFRLSSGRQNWRTRPGSTHFSWPSRGALNIIACKRLRQITGQVRKKAESFCARRRG